MFNVNITARSFDPQVAYVPFKSMTVVEKRVNFLKDSLVEEVMSAPSSVQQAKKIKKLKKLMKVSATVLATMSSIAPKAMAAVPAMATNTAVQTITPALILKWGLTVALISVAAGVALSMTMLSVAGIYRMFRKGEMATQWTSDIIRGLTQVLIAVPVVFLLYFLAQLAFQHLSMLKSLF